MKTRYKILGGIALLGAVAVAAGAIMVSHNAPCAVAPALAPGVTRMRAIVYRCYGSPDVLKVEELAKPVPDVNRVLVKVHAASVNPLDWHYMRGEPYIMRGQTGTGAPNDLQLGVDFAGVVEAVGAKVTKFKVGDAVFGGRNGAFGEYVSVRESGSIALQPTNATHAQSAALPIAGVTALQALRDKGKLQRGQQVLINGASGGVGTFAVQIAKYYGAEVWAVCSSRNVALVQSLGADHVIDYTKEDFTKSAQQYDLILDSIGNHSAAEYRGVLKPTGTLVMVGATDKGKWLGPLSGTVKTLLINPFVSKKSVFMLAELTQQDLIVLRDLVQAGKLTSAIDRKYTLDQVPEAIRYLEDGHARGKVIIDLDAAPAT